MALSKSDTHLNRFILSYDYDYDTIMIYFIVGLHWNLSFDTAAVPYPITHNIQHTNHMWQEDQTETKNTWQI